MFDWQRCHYQISIGKWRVDDLCVRPDVTLNQSIREKCPSIHVFQGLHAAWRRMQGKRFTFPPAERPQLIKSSDVIEVPMRVNYRVNFPQALAQRLHP